MTKPDTIDRCLRVWSYIFSGPLAILASPFFRWYEFWLTSDFKRSSDPIGAHKDKVKKVISQVKAWNEHGRNGLMCTARPGWKALSTHNMDKGGYTQIGVDALEDLVEIDLKNMVVTVEPGMVMGRLTRILLPKGLIVPVVPEFESLTVGGCVCGTGIETSSHKFGLFNETCLSYEVILPDGSLVTCNKDENTDLFHAIPWSHGTLGFLTAVKIKLIPAAKYVRVQYYPVTSIELAKVLLQDSGHLFVEGIMFGLNKVVVMHGDMAETPKDDGRVNHINRWHKPWFYKHVQSFLSRPSSGKPFIEYIPTRDYYHRHQRSYFWEAIVVCPYGNNPIFRLLFGWVYPISWHIVKKHLPQIMWDRYFVRNHVLQDFMVPMPKLEATLKICHDLVQVYPLWLCPCLYFNKPGFVHATGNADEMFIDVGVYGKTTKVNDYDTETTTRQLEKFCIESKGYQFLYADSYLSLEDFNRMFDTKLYEKVRAKYGCHDAFPDIYGKVSRQARSGSGKVKSR